PHSPPCRSLLLLHLSSVVSSRLFFFFFMTLPSPRSPFFPYTTLFRSFRGLVVVGLRFANACARGSETRLGGVHLFFGRRDGRKRSEEHTSELQSLTNLVCRLLLEKKKNKKYTTHRQKH